MILGSIAILSALASLVLCLGTDAFAFSRWLWQLPVGFVGIFLATCGLLFLIVWLACAVVRMEKPQERDSRFYRVLLRFLARAAHEILQMRVQTRGLEKIPQSGRFLLVCNHINDLDPVVLLRYFSKKQLAFISKRENSGMFLVGKLMHKTMCQMINRENDREALKTILTCIRLLQEDLVSVAVFPEGYTSKDGLLHPFRSGVFKIALKAKVPIVICTVQNTNRVFRNAMKCRPTQVHLHVLEVLSPEQIQGKTAVQIGEYVHQRMAEDLGPDLVLPEAP